LVESETSPRISGFGHNRSDLGTGKRAGWLGSFILACRDPNTGDFLECGMLGTGVKEKKIVEEDVTFKELTKVLKPLIESEKGNEISIKPKIVLRSPYEEIRKAPPTLQVTRSGSQE